MARLRSAPSAPPPTANATTTNTRAALREKTNTTRTTRAKDTAGTAEKDGGDFVKESVKPRRGRGKAAPQNETALTMAGGLGQREATGDDHDDDTIHVAQSEHPMTTDELAKSDAPLVSVTKPGRRPPRMTRKPVHTGAQSKVLDGLKKRMQAAANREAIGAKVAKGAAEHIESSSDPLPTKPSAKRKSAAPVVERSEFSISPSPPPPGKLSSVNKRTSVAPPGSVLKVHGTPAVETSILALKNFKRRPRQGSMLAMVQQRTASVRPSLAVTHQNEDASVFDLDASDEEDEFAPEAEGTPLQLSKAKKPVSAKRTQTPAKISSSATVANTKKRKSDGLDSSNSALDALRTKRHKSDLTSIEDDPMPMPDEYELARPLSSDRQVTPQPQATSDVQVLNSSPQPSSTPPTEPSSTEKHAHTESQDFAVPSTEEQEKQTFEGEDDEDEFAADFAPNATQAEPASSLEGSPVPDTQHTDVFADPLTQFSPPPPARQTKTKQKAKSVSTATLQSLLPKRRARAQPRGKRTEYDISSDDDDDEDTQLDASHLEEDEDELGGRLRRRTLRATPVKSKKAKAKARQSKAPLSARKSGKSTAQPAKAKAVQTYGRKNKAAATSDKENELYESAPEDEEDSSVLDTTVATPGQKSKELEAARKKFAEVDDWDMSFESMSAEDHRSSSQGWR